MKIMMKKFASIKSLPVLVLASLLVLGSVSADDHAEAPKPAPTLSGTTDYDFVAPLGLFDAEGRLLAWQGTVTGDIEGIIQWWMAIPMATGQVTHYEDRWVILDSEGRVLLAGDEAGCTTVRHGKNSIWRTNGTVTEASDEYADWLGRPVHEEGSFTWAEPGLPDHGYGTIRVN